MTVKKTIKKSNVIKIVLIMLFFTIISSILTFSFPVFVMQFLLATVTIPLLIKKDYKAIKVYLLIFIVAIFFMFLVYLGNMLYYGQPYYIGGSDDLSYEKWGYEIYNANMANPYKVMESGIIGQFHNSPFFVVYISLLIRFANLFGGYSTFLPRVINVYFLIWICNFIEYFLRKHPKFSEKKILMIITIFALTPNILYINSHVFRDTFNLMQIFTIVYLFDKLLNKKIYLKKILYIILLVFLLFITYYTRKNSIALAGVLCLLIVSEKVRIKKIYLIIVFAPIIVLTNLLEGLNFERYIGNYTSYILGGSEGGLSTFVFAKPLLPIGIFLRALYALISPFPNFFGLFKEPAKILLDFISLLIYLGVSVQVLVIPFIIKRIVKLDWISLSFLGFFSAVIIATFTFRHVILYYPFMVAVAVDGYSNSNKNTRKVTMFLSGLIAIGFALIYLSLKIFL